MSHTYTLLEDFTYKVFENINVYNPHQLDIETIAGRLGMIVNYFDGSSTFAFNQFFLDDRLTYAEQWQDFGHEMCHALFHSGNQRLLSPTFVQYQEWKANNFMYEFCVPQFMLRKFMTNEEDHPINLIIENFHVTPEFARVRYEKYMMKLYQRQLDTAFQKQVK